MSFFKETFCYLAWTELLLHASCRSYVSAHAWGSIKMRRDCTEGFSPFATVFGSIMLQYLEGLVTGLQWIHQDTEGFHPVPVLEYHRAQGPTGRDGKSCLIGALKISLLSFFLSRFEFQFTISWAHQNSSFLMCPDCCPHNIKDLLPFPKFSPPWQAA